MSMLYVPITYVCNIRAYNTCIYIQNTDMLVLVLSDVQLYRCIMCSKNSPILFD
jgi:hypothetical protein